MYYGVGVVPARQYKAKVESGVQLAECWIIAEPQYAAGIVPAADVIQMRAECWQQLGGHEMETGDPSLCSLRAVICVLYTPQEDQQDDLVDLLSFF